MLFDFSPADSAIGDTLISTSARWGVDSEYGRLLDVMVSAPRHLELVPCNAVAIENDRNGVVCCPDTAADQHDALVTALEKQGVRCHFVPPAPDMPDLSFTRDATLMTPWGLLQLNPAVEHRIPEADHIVGTARGWGVPILGKLPQGQVEGGDVCLLRPGIVVIGYSGERTDKAGAEALARMFEGRGWRAILYRFDPEFLHLDTHFTLIDRNTALACVEALDWRFVAELKALGISFIPVSLDEVRRLGANILSLGGGRVISSAGNDRVNGLLEERGIEVIAVEIDQFTQCGGGVHCLTMPLSRALG